MLNQALRGNAAPGPKDDGLSTSFGPASDNMHMQMKNNLPSPSLDIDKDTIAGFINPLRHRHFLGDHYHFRQNGLIGFGQIVNTADVLFGND